MSRFHHIASDLPAGPPPEVLDEIDAAWERAQVLVDGEFELHFAVDEPFHRVSAQLRRADGTFAQRLPAMTALAIACGDLVAAHASRLAV